MRRKRFPILWPILLSILISILFFGLAYFAMVSDTTKSASFICYISTLFSQLGNYTVSILTLWYVYLTYHLLIANIDLRDQAIQPYAVISWEKNSEMTETKFADSKHISEYFARMLKMPSSEDDSNYVILALKNIKNQEIKHVNITLIVEARNGPDTVVSKTMNYASDIIIMKDQEIRIGVCELKNIPIGIDVNIQIKNIAYSSTDGTEELTAYTGNQEFNTKGVEALTQAISAIPGSDKILGGTR